MTDALDERQRVEPLGAVNAVVLEEPKLPDHLPVVARHLDDPAFARGRRGPATAGGDGPPAQDVHTVCRLRCLRRFGLESAAQSGMEAQTQSRDWQAPGPQLLPVQR